MNTELLFIMINLLVAPFWFLMLVLPKWTQTQRMIRSLWVAMPVALIYAVLVVPQMGSLLGELAQPSAEGIAQLLSDPAAATIGWAHFLAFDLFVGRYIYLESRQDDVSAWITTPILFLTLMFGPIGFVCWTVYKTVKK